MGIFSVNIVAFAIHLPRLHEPLGLRRRSSAPTSPPGSPISSSSTARCAACSRCCSAPRCCWSSSGRSPPAGPVPRSHFRRMIVLALFGLAHFYFIWFGDILFLYAVIGMIAYLFVRKPPRSLLIWAASLFLVNAAMMAASSAYFRSADAEAHAADATRGGDQRMEQCRRLGPAERREDRQRHRHPPRLGGRARRPYAQRAGRSNRSAASSSLGRKRWR